MTSRKQLLPLTGLRFFLALWVVIYHQTSPQNYLGPSMAKLPEAIFCFLRTGYLAVGIFFLLSGFVLSYSHSLTTSFTAPRLANFAIGRFARIYPTYCLGLLLIAPFIVAHVLTSGSVGFAIRETAKAFLNWTLLQSWVPRAALSWNPPGWSLSDETFFYCCFPFVGVALWKLSGLRRILLACALIWAASLVAPLIAFTLPLRPFGLAPATSAPWDANPFWANLISFNPLLRFPDFCLGILVCRLYFELRWRNSSLLGKGYWLYVPGLVLELLVLTRSNVLPLPFVQNGLLLPLHSLVILGFALGGGACGRLLSTSPVVFLGNASYAMYILHVPLFFWLNTIAKKFLHVKPSGFGWMLFYLAAVICVSCVVFKALEQPANRALKMFLTRQTGRSAENERIGQQACASG
jgi:peptidoglycan/LPS O-acetylase OafA/YrhL